MSKSGKSKKAKAIRIASACAALLLIVIVVVLATAMRPHKPSAVGTAKAELGPLEEVVSASGVLKALRSSAITSRTVGRVASVLVKPGDIVAAGRTIVLVDDEAARTALTNAEIALEEARRNALTQLGELKAAYRRAQAALAQAKRSMDASRELKEVDGISAESWRQAVEALEQAELAAAGCKDALRLAQGLGPDEEPEMDGARDPGFAKASPSYQRASHALQEARRALAACDIKADSAGTVVELSVDPGSYVQNGTPVARIEDLAAVSAEVNVDEVDIGKLEPGQKASISADSLLGKELAGRVSAVRPVVKSSGTGRVCAVAIDVDLGSAKALSGASCMARITSRLKEEALQIPAAALIPSASPPAVWLLEKRGDAKDPSLYAASRREISIGASTASRLEVLSGLAEGDLVAVDGLKALSEGARVRDRAK